MVVFKVTSESKRSTPMATGGPKQPNSNMIMRYHLPLAVPNRYILLCILENCHRHHSP